MQTLSLTFRKRRFTLLEMIVVMVIMLTLMVATVPVLKSTTKNVGVNQGASILAGAVRSARLKAMSSRKYVALLVPTAEPSDEGGVDDPHFRAASLRMCYLLGPPTQTFQGSDAYFKGIFDAYVEHSSWEFLPSRTYITYTEGFGPFEHTLISPSISKYSTNVVSSINFPENVSASQVDNMRALIFKPDGSLYPCPRPNILNGNTTNPYIEIINGSFDTTNSYILRQAPDSQKRRMQINRFSGRVTFFK